jgi:hypothetical protein
MDERTAKILEDNEAAASLEGPDMSIGEFAKFTEFLITDKSIPPNLSEPFWGFGDKENAISNLRPDDIKSVLNQFEIARLTYLMSKPEFEHSWKDELALNNLRPKLQVKLKRSEGGFERRLEATQIRQIQTDSLGREQKKGFLGRIFGFGGGK